MVAGPTALRDGLILRMADERAKQHEEPDAEQIHTPVGHTSVE
jgi:hypothetical protein